MLSPEGLLDLLQIAVSRSLISMWCHLQARGPLHGVR